MATTIPTLSPGMLRETLQQILELAEDVREAESAMREKAAQLERSDYESGRRYVGAISGGLDEVFELLVRNDPHDHLAIDDLIERVVDTIGVVDLAIRHAEEVGDAS